MSSCYLLYIPDNFDPEKYFDWIDNALNSKVKKPFLKFITILKKDGAIDLEYISDFIDIELSEEDNNIFWDLVDKLKSKYIVNELDLGFGDDTLLININMKKIQKNIEKIKRTK